MLALHPQKGEGRLSPDMAAQALEGGFQGGLGAEKWPCAARKAGLSRLR